MFAQLILVTVLAGQCSEHHTLVNTGIVRSKVYVRTVFQDDGFTTEIPVINGLIPTIQMNRRGFRLDLIMDYRCGTIHGGGTIYLHRIDPPVCGTLPPPKDEKIAPVPLEFKNSENSEVKSQDGEILRTLRELNERVRRLEERPSPENKEAKVTPIPSFTKSN